MNASFRLLSMAAAVGAFALTGCLQTTEVGVIAEPPAYTDPSKIEMLSAPPTRSYELLGEIALESGDWRNEQVAETKIRTEAGRMLADAVIVYGRSGPQNPQAIRYTDNTPARSAYTTAHERTPGGATSTGGTGGSGIGSGGAFPDGGLTPGH
jgi:hypothetical protein